MANLDRPRGFQVVGEPLRITAYVAGGTMYPGDAVKMVNDGKVAVAAAGDLLLGVIANYVVSGGTALVYDHPDQVFVGQLAGSEIDQQTDLFNAVDILATAGDATYKVSRHELDGSTQSGSATAQVRLLAIENTPNNALGLNVAVTFRINEHFFTAAQANSPIGV